MYLLFIYNKPNIIYIRTDMTWRALLLAGAALPYNRINVNDPLSTLCAIVAAHFEMFLKKCEERKTIWYFFSLLFCDVYAKWLFKKSIKIREALFR